MNSVSLARSARVFHALSDGTRLRILELLREGERCVCDLSEAVGAQQSRLSFHLRTLKEAGLVTDRRQGRWIYYAVRPEGIDEVEGLLRPLRGVLAGAELS